MEPFKLALLRLDEYTLAELRQDDKIQDDGSSEQGILTSVVQDDGVVAAHEDFGRVFIHGTLAVTNVWHVLDHHLGKEQ